MGIPLRPITVKIKEGSDAVLTLPKPLLEMFGLEDGETVKIPIQLLIREKQNEEKPLIYTEDEVEVLGVAEAKRGFEQAMNYELFRTLVERIQKEFPYLKMNLHKSMVSFYRNRRGVLWIEYPKGRNVRTHLKKADYSSVDFESRIIPEGWGGYPQFIVEKEQDIDYLFRLLKHAMEV